MASPRLPIAVEAWPSQPQGAGTHLAALRNGVWHTATFDAQTRFLVGLKARGLTLDDVVPPGWRPLGDPSRAVANFENLPTPRLSRLQRFAMVLPGTREAFESYVWTALNPQIEVAHARRLLQLLTPRVERAFHELADGRAHTEGAALADLDFLAAAILRYRLGALDEACDPFMLATPIIEALCYLAVTSRYRSAAPLLALYVEQFLLTNVRSTHVSRRHTGPLSSLMEHLGSRARYLECLAGVRVDASFELPWDTMVEMSRRLIYAIARSYDVEQHLAVEGLWGSPAVVWRPSHETLDELWIFRFRHLGASPSAP